MRKFILGFIIATVLQYLAWEMSSTYNETITKNLTADLQVLAGIYKVKVTETIINNNSIENSGIGISVSEVDKKHSDAVYADVTRDGTIVVKAKEAGQLLIYKPIYKDKIVDWLCIGGPNELMINDCSN